MKADFTCQNSTAIHLYFHIDHHYSLPPNNSDFVLFHFKFQQNTAVSTTTICLGFSNFMLNLRLSVLNVIVQNARNSVGA
jgi:hypothetical protein